MNRLVDILLSAALRARSAIALDQPSAGVLAILVTMWLIQQWRQRTGAAREPLFAESDLGAGSSSQGKHFGTGFAKAA